MHASQSTRSMTYSASLVRRGEWSSLRLRTDAFHRQSTTELDLWHANDWSVVDLHRRDRHRSNTSSSFPCRRVALVVATLNQLAYRGRRWSRKVRTNLVSPVLVGLYNDPPMIKAKTRHDNGTKIFKHARPFLRLLVSSFGIATRKKIGSGDRQGVTVESVPRREMHEMIEGFVRVWDSFPCVIVHWRHRVISVWKCEDVRLVRQGNEETFATSDRRTWLFVAYLNICRASAMTWDLSHRSKSIRCYVNVICDRKILSVLFWRNSRFLHRNNLLESFFSLMISRKRDKKTQENGDE